MYIYILHYYHISYNIHFADITDCVLRYYNYKTLLPSYIYIVNFHRGIVRHVFLIPLHVCYM